MEAGVLYEKAQSWDKAAAVYIKLKNWSGITFCYLELHDYICMPHTFYYIICYSNHWSSYELNSYYLMS